MDDKAITELLMRDAERGIQNALLKYGKAVRKIIRVIMVSSPEQDMEEVFMDSFVKLWEKRQSLDADKSLKAYLYAIARSAAIDRLRRSKTMLYMDDDILLAIVDGDDFTKEIETEELHQQLLEVIRELESPKNQIFYCRYFLNMSVKRIAAFLDIKEKKIENILSREKENLRKKLVKRGVDRYEI